MISLTLEETRNSEESGVLGSCLPEPPNSLIEADCTACQTADLSKPTGNTTEERSLGQEVSELKAPTLL